METVATMVLITMPQTTTLSTYQAVGPNSLPGLLSELRQHQQYHTDTHCLASAPTPSRPPNYSVSSSTTATGWLIKYIIILPFSSSHRYQRRRYYRRRCRSHIHDNQTAKIVRTKGSATLSTQTFEPQVLGRTVHQGKPLL